MDKAGLPQGLFQHLVLGHDDTAKMLSGGHVDHVSFTGSVEGGRAIERAAAGTFTSIGLELGGKDPAYVRADADVAHAVENLVDGAFFNSGQSCCGIERIYVHEQVWGPFVEGFTALTRTVRAGRSARAGHDARADGRDALRRSRAAPDRAGAGQGRQGAYRCGGVPAQPRRHAVAGAAGADRGRPRHGRDDAGELRPRGRADEGRRRRRGAAPHERFALWPDGVGVDARSRRPPSGSAAASRPAPST